MSKHKLAYEKKKNVCVCALGSKFSLKDMDMEL